MERIPTKEPRLFDLANGLERSREAERSRTKPRDAARRKGAKVPNGKKAEGDERSDGEKEELEQRGQRLTYARRDEMAEVRGKGGGEGKGSSGFATSGGFFFELQSAARFEAGR